MVKSIQEDCPNCGFKTKHIKEEEWYTDHNFVEQFKCINCEHRGVVIYS